MCSDGISETGNVMQRARESRQMARGFDKLGVGHERRRRSEPSWAARSSGGVECEVVCEAHSVRGETSRAG